MNKIIAAFTALLGLFATQTVQAQSGCPAIVYGAVLTAAQWNACFAGKQDVLNYTPVNKAGDTMFGRLVMNASTTSRAGINLTPGVAPTSPVNGDMWTDSTGLYVRINGSTVGPVAPAGVTTISFGSTGLTPSSATGGAVTVAGTLGVANGGTGLTSGTSGGILAFTASGILASSAALTANRLVLGGGAGAAPTVLGSSGTSTTVLHGNASGSPTFGAVSLTADVSGTLPVANGGTGITSFGTGVGTALGQNVTGSGGIVLATSPTLTTPVLGAATATSINGLGITGSTGTLTVANGKTATVSNTLTFTGTDGVTIPFGTRTRQVFTSGSGTYTTPANVKYISVRMVAGGGGGAGSGTTPGAATAGGNTTFSTFTANGGALGTTGGGPCSGGTASGGSVNITGGLGGPPIPVALSLGGTGGGTPFGSGAPGAYGGNTGSTAVSNTGAGGGGGGGAGTANSGGGGCGGGYLEGIITAPAASYSYAVGAAGSAGTAGTGGQAGGNGGSGLIIVDEFYQ